MCCPLWPFLQYDDLPSAKHARDLAVLAVHGPRLVPTLNPIENYTQEQIAAVRQQMAEKPAARTVMVNNGLWPPAGQDIAPEQLQQEKRSRRLPGLQHLVPFSVKKEKKTARARVEQVVQAEAAPAAVAGDNEQLAATPAAAAAADEAQAEPEAATAAQQESAVATAVEAAAAPAQQNAPRMRASVATTLALAAAAAGGSGSTIGSQVKVEQHSSGAAAVAAAAAAAAGLQHYHARATANPTGTTGIREHKGKQTAAM